MNTLQPQLPTPVMAGSAMANVSNSLSHAMLQEMINAPLATFYVGTIATRMMHFGVIPKECLARKVSGLVARRASGMIKPALAMAMTMSVHQIGGSVTTSVSHWILHARIKVFSNAQSKDGLVIKNALKTLSHVDMVNKFAHLVTGFVTQGTAFQLLHLAQVDVENAI